MTADHQWIGKEVRVRFDLDVEDGFPPISAEFLIGILESEDIVRLDNTPFFAEGVALGDTVRCAGSPPDMEFDRIVGVSGYKAVSIIFIEKSYENELYQSLKSSGCYVELGELPEYDMLAVAVPPDTDYDGIRSLVESSEADGKISFAELCLR